jgi:HAD superfamily hydrolase (TIGR01509 family)
VIAAVIFDVDGLMVDSEPLAKEAWQITARGLGHPIDDALFEAMLGRRHIDTAVILVERFGLSMTPDALVSMRNETFYALLPGRIRPMAGLHELLSALQARGLRRAVGTSGQPRYISLLLRELGLDSTFDAIATGEEVTHGKPAPDVYLLAAQRLNIAPAQCLVLEDAPFGVQAAKNAGMKCVAVPNDMTRSLDLSAADASLSSLLAVRDNLDVLAQW